MKTFIVVHKLSNRKTALLGVYSEKELAEKKIHKEIIFKVTHPYFTRCANDPLDEILNVIHVFYNPIRLRKREYRILVKELNAF